ncbi:MAG TPA: hypothetical protein VGI73_11660 [Solirubrobacterales bacterium]
MPSARPGPSRRPRPLLRAAVLAACLALVGAGVAGCETTQEKAAKQQARAAHILKARAERQAKKQREKSKHHHGKEHEE